MSVPALMWNVKNIWHTLIGFSIIYLQISAQESRRKKKEFVDTLERKVDVAVQELEDYKKKCELLQKQNTSLRSQMKSLRSILANNNSMAAVTTIKPDPDCKYLSIRT